MTKEEKQQKREERIERAKDFAGHCVELAADTSIICRTAVQWKMEIQKLFVSRRERRGVMIRGVSLSNAPICINLLEKILL